jgi:tetratricopeptide (TPR) repeat protein
VNGGIRAALAGIALGVPTLRPASPDEPWAALTRYRFPEARAAFAAGPETVANRFGLALSLINLQPKTDANLARADSLLQAIGAAASPGDDHAAAARYYRGRIQQVHLRRPDPAAARRIYRALMDDYPASFWGQLAGIKWMTLELYATEPAAGISARLSQLETLAPFFSRPQLAKDYHNIMANAYEGLGLSPDRAYAHLARCWQIGVARGVDQGDFLARLGTLATRLGRTEEARHYFGEFLRRFARDERRFLIEQQLARLPPGEARP